ncbi:MAG TPA: hypothetical protein VGL44_13910 [Gaiellales bacterium]
MAVRLRDLALGIVVALFVLIGPAPADIAGLFQHPPAPCLQSTGCGHSDAWWDRPVLVARAAELTTPPHLTHATVWMRR